MTDLDEFAKAAMQVLVAHEAGRLLETTLTRVGGVLVPNWTPRAERIELITGIAYEIAEEMVVSQEAWAERVVDTAGH